MNQKDKWNKKYIERIDERKLPAVNPRLEKLVPYLKGGHALDIACGLGANSIFLAQLGYEVKASDISDVAINYVQVQAEKQHLSIEPYLCDLTEWRNLNVAENSLDLVVITYYLDRTIFPIVRSIIKECGYLFIETFYLSPQHEEQKVSDHYKLQPKELLAEFGDWQVLYYEENEIEGRQTIFVRNRE